MIAVKEQTVLIEARVGNEWHSSAWGKGNLQGAVLVAESHTKGKHETYVTGAVLLPPGTVLSWWTSNGDKRGTSEADFYLLAVDDTADELELTGGCYGRGNYLRGRLRVLAHGSGKTFAQRLLDWWINWAPKNGGKTERMALHLAEQLKVRGLKEPGKLKD